VPKSSGAGGFLLYTLAQKRCENFGTCLKTGNDVGMANVNSEIFQKFREGKQNLLLGDCEQVRPAVERITQLMTVPLVQGTLRYAFAMDKQNDAREKAEAEGAAYAAAVLPLLNDCNETDADIVYDNMRVGNGGTANFEDVKTAFERNYQCMGITCDLVGGLVDIVNGGFLEGAEPCGYQKPGEAAASSTSTSTGDDGPNVGLAVGLTVGIVAVLIIIALLISRKADEKEYDGAAEPEMIG
jgi:hypothetical protein